MKRSAALMCCCLLAACGGEGEKEENVGKTASALDAQAVEAGILPDPENLSLAGQFETRSELGVDKFCATDSGDNFDIGVLAVFGPESKCEAQGSARLANDKLQISLRGEDECEFKAEYDGVSIRFPGALSEGCDSYCTPRATFAGTSYFMISQGDDAAKRTLGRDIDRLCS